MAAQLVPYHAPWTSVPIATIDFETTGIQPGRDRAVEVGVARFEGGRCVGALGGRVNPHMPIPESATAVHGITDADVADAPDLLDFFADPQVRALLAGAQPGAYNAPFDKWFCPPSALADWTWPWLDAMVLVVEVDKYVRGAGRYKLSSACERHGVRLSHAHSAQADAKATGELLHVLINKRFSRRPSIGDLLSWTRQAEAERWSDFHSWLGKQPAREATP